MIYYKLDLPNDKIVTSAPKNMTNMSPIDSSLKNIIQAPYPEERQHITCLPVPPLGDGHTTKSYQKLWFSIGNQGK